MLHSWAEAQVYVSFSHSLLPSRPLVKCSKAPGVGKVELVGHSGPLPVSVGSFLEHSPPVVSAPSVAAFMLQQQD